MKAKEIMELVKKVSHDFGNHLQVVSGYIDLGQPERAKNYIFDIVEIMNSDKVLFKDIPDEQALYFYLQKQAIYELGVHLIYQSINIRTFDRIKQKNEPLESIKRFLKEQNSKEELFLNLLIYEEDNEGIVMLFHSKQWENQQCLVKIDRSE